MNWVWLDEFIPLAYKKLPGIDSEGNAIRAIVKTIEHDSLSSRAERGLKPVRVILFANPFTWNNPILSYFHVLPRYGRYRAGPDIAVEMLEPLPSGRKRGEKMTSEEFLGAEVNRNQGWKNQLAFVRERWPTVTPRWSLRFGSDFFTVYLDEHCNAYCRRCDGHSGCERFSVGVCDEGEEIMGKRLREFLKKLTFTGKITYRNINDKFDFQNLVTDEL